MTITTGPGRADLRADLCAAVREAYTDEGVLMWWRNWLASDGDHRERMETGVLLEWSGAR